MQLNGYLGLTPEQAEQFRENGYVKIAGVLGEQEQQKLKEAIDRMCNTPEDLVEAAIIPKEDGNSYLVGIDRIIGKSEPVFARILGSPWLLALAESICGSAYFPVQDFVVIKNKGDENPVNWHQDVLSKTPCTSFMIGFYLDPANDANGALRVVPGSHKSDLHICQLKEMAYNSIEMDAGDVLVHDLRIAHSSGLLSTFEKRRVVYFEFMNANLILEEKIYPESFVALRSSLIPLAKKCHSSLDLTDSENPFRQIQELCKSPLRNKSANYCFDFQ